MLKKMWDANIISWVLVLSAYKKKVFHETAIKVKVLLYFLLEVSANNKFYCTMRFSKTLMSAHTHAHTYKKLKLTYPPSNSISKNRENIEFIIFKMMIFSAFPAGQGPVRLEKCSLRYSLSSVSSFSSHYFRHSHKSTRIWIFRLSYQVGIFLQ